jgi:hypothetical protein
MSVNAMRSTSDPSLVLRPGKPSLRSAVFHVGAAVPDKQVVRSNARRIVAMMQHPHPGRNMAVVKFPRDSMRRSMPFMANAVDPNHPVSVCVFRPGPFPTTVSLSDLRPKPLLDGKMWFSHDLTASIGRSVVRGVRVWIHPRASTILPHSARAVAVIASPRGHRRWSVACHTTLHA